MSNTRESGRPVTRSMDLDIDRAEGRTTFEDGNNHEVPRANINVRNTNEDSPDELLFHQLTRALRNSGSQKVKAPVFDGKTDVQSFIDTFEQVCLLNNWSEEEKALHLRLSLKESAARCVYGNSYEGMKGSLLSRYELSADEALRELRSLTIRPAENIYEFAEYVKRLVRLGHPTLTEDQRTETAIRELVEAIGDKWLRREFRLQPPASFTDALKRIQEFNNDMDRGRQGPHLRQFQHYQEPNEENSLYARVGKLESEVGDIKRNVTGIDNRLQETAQATQEGLRTLTESIKLLTTKLDQRRDKSTVTCYNCRKLGHYARECRSRNEQPQSQSQSNQTENDNGRRQ